MPELTFAEVGQILRLLQTVEASEVDLEWGDLRLRVRSGVPGRTDETPEAAVPDTEPTITTEPETPSVSEPEATVTRASQVAETVPDHWVAIGAPMVSTFYRSPKPGEPAYVDVGDVVGPGDTVGLVEVMKLFTELKAEVGGKVARIDADDGALVEFGQPLIWIEPS